MLLILLLTFAFLLRVDGMTRYSAWNDELASAVFANPNSSINSIFADGANPFFYHLLLRIWFTITGWSETTGRILSVLLGTGGIFTLYLFVKSICGKKYAFVSALLLTISYTSLGYSNEIRSYALQIMLCPLISLTFMRHLKIPSFKNSCIYVVLGIMLVNTHYYGVFLIAGIFFYFTFEHYTIKRLVFFFTNKGYALERKLILKFVLMNLIIVLSLIPFFIIMGHTVLLNKNTMTWLPKPGERELFYGILVLLIYIASKVFIIMANKFMKLDKNKITLLNYVIFLVMFIYLTAYIISISYRNIFHWRYLTICIPLIIAILPIFVFCVFDIKPFKNIQDIFLLINLSFLSQSRKLTELELVRVKVANIIWIAQILLSFILLTFLLHFVNNWSLFGKGNNDVHKQSREYILKDSRNYNSTAEILIWESDESGRANAFYGGHPTKEYSKEENNYDFIYLNPTHKSDSRMNDILTNNNISLTNILKIRLNRRDTMTRYIYKIKESTSLDEK